MIPTFVAGTAHPKMPIESVAAMLTTSKVADKLKWNMRSVKKNADQPSRILKALGKGEIMSGLDLNQAPEGLPAGRRLALDKPQDFGAGAIFAAIGIIGLVLSKDYRMGTTAQMGPGYVPRLLCYCLILMGIIIAGRAFHWTTAVRTASSPKPAMHFDSRTWRVPLIILGSIVLFAVLIDSIGLGLATLLLIVLSAWADPTSRPIPVLISGVLLAVFSVALFVHVLALPIPAWPNFATLGFK